MTNIILYKDDISEEIIINKLYERINELDRNMKEEDKEKIIIHGLAQISNVIDRISKMDSALDNEEYIIVPEYDVNEDGFLQFKDPLLKKSNIKNDKESLLEFLYNLCITTANYGVKGVKKNYDYQQKYKR